MTPINRYLDAAVLKPETTRDEMIDAVKTCIALNTFSVCVRPCDLATAKELCESSKTLVCVVLGFPHGDQLPISKANEAEHYIALGADEIDMVANYGWARSGRWDDVLADIAGVTALTKPAGVPLKVIFETAQLDSDTIRRLTEVSIEAGADFVKTSTGFNGEGAKEENIRLMLETATGRIDVKASGGIRDGARARKFLDMGVARLGVNWAACEAICRGDAFPAEGSY